MNSSFITSRLGGSIVYSSILSLKIDFFQANSADPHEITHYSVYGISFCKGTI